MSEENKPGDKPEQSTSALISLQGSRLDEVGAAFPRAGRTLATVALAVALIVGGIALYVWKEFEQGRASAALSQDELSDRIGNLESSNTARLADLEKAREGSEQVVRENQAIKGALDELRTRVTRDRGEWLLAEVDYLMAMANRKLRFERDVAAAILALEDADDRLQLLNDPSLVPVRAAIGRDLQALRRVPAVERTSLALQLTSLIEATGELPLAQGLAGPSSAAAAKAARPPVTDVGSFFSALWSDIRGLVTFHRTTQPVTPLLPPEQRYYLRQNLALKLETARVALLQREPAAYQGALTEAQAWVNQYFDPAAPAVRASAETLAKLRTTDIAPELPDIGESLRQLRRIKRQLEAEMRGGAER